MKMKTWQAVTILVLAAIAIFIIGAMRHAPREVINPSNQPHPVLAPVTPQPETISPAKPSPKPSTVETKPEPKPIEPAPVVKDPIPTPKPSAQLSQAQILKLYNDGIEFYKRRYETYAANQGLTAQDKAQYIDDVVAELVKECDQPNVQKENAYCLSLFNATKLRADLTK